MHDAQGLASREERDMIREKEGIFLLETRHSSFLFEVMET